jgi:hypothetical protein
MGAGASEVEIARSDAATASAPDPLLSTAWLLALPCAALTTAIVFFLGPPLSHVLYPAKLPFHLLPNIVRLPEPIEGTRYLLSLSAPVLLAAGIALTARRPPIPSRVRKPAVFAVQLVGLAVVVACIVRQRERGWQIAFFEGWQLAAAAPIALALLFAARRGWLTRHAQERRVLRVAIALLAVLVTGAWFLSFVNTDRSIWTLGDPYNTGFQYDEPAAVLNGLTPLVDFTPTYGSVWALVIAPWLWWFGESLLVFTIAMWVLTIVTLLAIYATLRRVTHSALAALALYLPIMALSFFGAVRDVHHPLAIYQEMPLRNAAPFLLAWLVARQLDRSSRSTWPLFLAAGCATLNNFEFGVAALGGTLGAVAWTSVPLDRRQLRRIATGVAAGLAGAYALFAVVTLILAGALPDLARGIAFARIYAVGGVGLNRLPHVIGLPLVIFLTYAAAIGAATLRAVRREPNRVLTGLLAWSAIYGFGSGAYFMGESSPKGIPTMFPAWSFSLALLTIVVVQQLAGRPRRRPTLALLAVLFGFAAIGTFVLDPPSSVEPWSQLQAIRTSHLTVELEQLREVGTAYVAPRYPEFLGFMGAMAESGGGPLLKRGDAIALLWSTGHAIADAYGFKDVVPLNGESIFTYEQLDETLHRLRAAKGAIVLVPTLIAERLGKALSDRGFVVLAEGGYTAGIPGRTIPAAAVATQHGLTKWVDRAAFRPNAAEEEG